LNLPAQKAYRATVRESAIAYQQLIVTGARGSRTREQQRNLVTWAGLLSSHITERSSSTSSVNSKLETS